MRMSVDELLSNGWLNSGIKIVKRSYKIKSKQRKGKFLSW